jgi:hypothetical protein
LLWRIADRSRCWRTVRCRKERMEELAVDHGVARVLRWPRGRQRTRSGTTVTSKNAYIRIGLLSSC